MSRSNNYLIWVSHSDIKNTIYDKSLKSENIKRTKKGERKKNNRNFAISFDRLELVNNFWADHLKCEVGKVMDTLPITTYLNSNIQKL